MGQATGTLVEEAQLSSPQVQEAFGRLRTSVVLYGVISAIVLGTVAVLAFGGQSVTSFMWVRSAILLAVSVLIHRMVVSAAQGSRRAYERVRTLTVILPIAIIGVDLIPGLCPSWFAVMQGVSALALVLAATVTRGAQLRTVFPKSA
ncbi:hypothetical protein SSP35_09_00200 [Streptomyces sp. NBRC 110611]|uniref:hypothetical protein n=1 Tax=Streptomyces sp. NBRC 110611 TaxID=1621259 RepID=UPI0008554823|nr:hypothetical protein [Streptomyces sp. NBRC 110611]GAU68777.1 hypothetical protein SSP35_09_00200 [Streptomyces sp. NBRC 110611]